MTDSVLDEAKAAIEDRMGKYGHPAPMHDVLAGMWTCYVKGVRVRGDTELTARDAANMCVLLKLAREACGGPLRDNLVDAAGYAEIGNMVG